MQLIEPIEFPRVKPRWWALTLGYRFMHPARLILGDRRLLRLMLNLEWIAWRFSWELSARLFGSRFLNEVLCVSHELLARYTPPGGTIIDVGCGEGRLAHMIPDGATLLGIDYDSERIEVASRTFAANPRVQFRHRDLTNPWPKDAVGDVATLIGVLEHVDDADGLLQRLHAVAPVIIVEVPDTDSTPLNWTRREVGARWYTDNDHVREYTRPLLQAQLCRTGWAPVEWMHRGTLVLAVCRTTSKTQP